MALEDNQQSQLDSSSVNCECTEIFQLGRKRQTIVAIPIASIKSYKAFCGHWRQQYATKLCNKLSIRGSIDWRKLALVALQSMSELWLPMSWRRLAWRTLRICVRVGDRWLVRLEKAPHEHSPFTILLRAIVLLAQRRQTWSGIVAARSSKAINSAAC